jgi:hypothetical protein
MIELDLAIAVGFQVTSIRAHRNSTLLRQPTETLCGLCNALVKGLTEQTFLGGR